jgi:hypothetical protein
LELKPVGTLEVKLVQARGLTNKDLIGKSDPFAIMYVRPLPDKMKRSKTIVSVVTSCCMRALPFWELANYVIIFTEQ